MKTKKKTYVIDAFTVHQIRSGKASMTEVARVIGCTPQTVANHVKSCGGKTKAAKATTKEKPPTKTARFNGGKKWRRAYGVINECLKKGLTMTQAAQKAGVSLSYAYAIRKLDQQACA